MSYKFIKIIKVQRLSLVFFCEFKSIYIYILSQKLPHTLLLSLKAHHWISDYWLRNLVNKTGKIAVTFLIWGNYFITLGKRNTAEPIVSQCLPYGCFLKINLAITNEYISHLLKCSHTDQDKEVLQCSETINVYIN